MHPRLAERSSGEMLELASRLAEFAKQHAEHILDVIHAHYRYAEANEWLDFWVVSAGLTRAQVMDEVDSVALVLDRELIASVDVNPHWDPEEVCCRASRALACSSRIRHVHA